MKPRQGLKLRIKSPVNRNLVVVINEGSRIRMIVFGSHDGKSNRTIEANDEARVTGK